MLIDTETGNIEPLFDAPLSFWYLGDADVVSWSPDSESVILPNTFLPLDVTDTNELELRQSGSCVAEVNIRTKSIERIAQLDDSALITSVGTDAVKDVLVGLSQIPSLRLLPTQVYHKTEA